MTYHHFIDELRWRDMIYNMTPQIETQLNHKMTVGYIGFDPTADSLHIGNLTAITLLMHLQKASHKPIVLLGGATGMIGDPSGKSAERKFLSIDELNANLTCLQKQFSKFLDFDCGDHSAEIVNNYDWYKDINLLTFLREVGKHAPINHMLARDSVKNRIETGISFTEFTYQLLQAFDFYWLNKNKNCKLQMGGSDQWGNITAGIDYCRRKDSIDVHGLTCPLLTKADGGKFGKTEEGNIWLDAKKTSVYKFYQFWINIDDKDISKLLRYFTLFKKDDIDAMEDEYKSDPNGLKRIIAKDITTRVHSSELCDKVIQASTILFGKSPIEAIESIEDDMFSEIIESIPTQHFSRTECQPDQTIQIISQLYNISKSETKRLIKGNGISINKEKLNLDRLTQPDSFSLLKQKYWLFQKGKQYALARFE